MSNATDKRGWVWWLMVAFFAIWIVAHLIVAIDKIAEVVTR